MKVMLLSDIHIGNYKTYNPTPDFRLNQFLKLKDFIVETCKLKDVYEIWIAGDLLQTAQSTPQVMSVVKTFLKGISERANVRIALGNHDVVVRSDKTDVSEYNDYTLVSLLDSMKNVYIYNDDVVHIGYKLVHFHSWVPSNDFQHKDANYLVCHGDIDKTLSPFSNNLINAKGYDRVFCGHIHKFKEIDNVLSLGTPLMHSFSDSPDVGLTIYDTDTDTYERVSTQGMFLEFKYAENEDKAVELSEDSKDKDVVIRVKSEKVDNIVDVSSLSIDPKSALTEFSKNLTEESQKILNNVISIANEKESQVPDLRVKFKSLKAENFLSIRSIDFNFENFNGLTTIKGNIGSGKSTLFNLIEFMLFGKLYGYNKSDYTSVYSGKFKGTLELEYKGITYKITRTLSSLEYTKNDKPQESNRKNDLQKCLEDDLQFLRFFNLIYVKQSSTGIFSDMSDTNRVSFLSNLIGLETIKVWTDLLNSEIKGIKEQNQEQEIERTRVETNIQNLKTFNEQNKEFNCYIKPELIDDDIETYRNKIEECNTCIKIDNVSISKRTVGISKLESDIEQRKNKCNEINSKFNTVKSLSKESKELENNKQTIEVIQVPVIDFESPSLDTEGLDDVDKTIQNIDKALNEKTVKLKLVTEKLNSLTNHPDVCPTCKQPWHVENLDEKVSKLNEVITELNKDIDELELDKSMCFDRKQRIQTKYQKELEEYKVKKSLYDSKLEKYVQYTKKVEEQRSLDEKILRIKDNILSLKTEIESEIKENKYFTVDGVICVDCSDLENSIKTHNSVIEKHKKSIEICENDIKQYNLKIEELVKKRSTIEYNNSMFNKIENNKKEIEILTCKLNEIGTKLENSRSIIDELSKFNTKILSDKGLLVASLLQKVASYLNTDNSLKVETVEELQNGSLKPTLNIKLFVKEYNKYVDYAMLSGGQRLLADLRFLKGITETLGSISILLLDETFKFFSTETVFEGVEIIKSMNVDKTFLILHGSDTESFSDKTINVVLTENGSKYIV